MVGEPRSLTNPPQSLNTAVTSHRTEPLNTADVHDKLTVYPFVRSIFAPIKIGEVTTVGVPVSPNAQDAVPRNEDL